MSRFDYYAATVHSAGPEDVIRAVCGGVVDLCSLQPARPRNGYHAAYDVTLGERRFGTVLFGTPGMGVHVQSSGVDTEETVGRLRHWLPDHLVARLDACEDYRGIGCFDRLTKSALAIADRYGIKVQNQGDWHRAEDGRTLYLGAPSSVVRLRIYEKGIQLRAQADVDETWTRVEVQVRPKKAGRSLLATAEADEVWGSARWAAELREEIEGTHVERLACGSVYRESDHERAMTFVVRQYGNTLRRHMEVCDGELEVWARDLWDRLARAATRPS